MKYKVYRFTYNGIGIYEALKQNISMDTWKQLLTSNAFTWLPKPSIYTKQPATSYFTKIGRDKFVKLTLPIITQYLDSNTIKEDEIYINPKDIVYSDLYQICII